MYVSLPMVTDIPVSLSHECDVSTLLKRVVNSVTKGVTTVSIQSSLEIITPRLVEGGHFCHLV